MRNGAASRRADVLVILMKEANVRAAMTTIVICGLLTASAWAQGAAAKPAQAAAPEAAQGAAVLKRLVGTWRAPEERTPRTSDLDEQVFGRGAMDVRTVSLTISPSGDGDLQVHRSVVGTKGKVFAPSIMDVKMHIGEPVTARLGHLEPTVTVKSAEERYLDGDHEKWPRDGSRVSLSVPDAQAKELNMQLDTPDGRGAFGVTLTEASARKSH